jgi:hypothetical protein
MQIAVVILVAVAIFLLVVVVYQSLVSRYLLEEIKAGPDWLNAMSREDEERGGLESKKRTIRAYNVVADPVGALLWKDPPSANDYVMFACGDDSKVVLHQGLYSQADLSWLILRESYDSKRLWNDVSKGMVRTAFLSGCAVRIWAKELPKREGQSREPYVHFVIGKYGADTSMVVDKGAVIGCTRIPVELPLGASNFGGHWSTMYDAINSKERGSPVVAMNVWAF